MPSSSKKSRGDKSAQPVDLTIASLKRSIRSHLKVLGFVRGPNGELVPPALTKDAIRALHADQRRVRLAHERDFIVTAWPKLKSRFASGPEVEPSKILPRLEPVLPKTIGSELFRLASLLWSVPVSAGYGRRIRYLVWDDSNGKLMGLLALGDPVFNLRVRDHWIGWTAKRRKAKLVNCLDAYVLGAIPPYNLILCGKLVASLVATKEVRDAFTRKYGARSGVISKRAKHPKLCLVTTSSALGRSSLYNRLKLRGIQIFRSIGYTEGWGHFHISDSLFRQMRRFLEGRRDKNAGNNRFGSGPNWKMRATRKTLALLGMNPDLLRHGIRREVFAAEIAQNAKSVLVGKAKHIRYVQLPTVAAVAALAKARWVIPRAASRMEYRQWTLEQTASLLVSQPLDEQRLQSNLLKK